MMSDGFTKGGIVPPLTRWQLEEVGQITGLFTHLARDRTVIVNTSGRELEAVEVAGAIGRLVNEKFGVNDE
jgi:hypothetical protein